MNKFQCNLDIVHIHIGCAVVSEMGLLLASALYIPLGEQWVRSAGLQQQ